MNQDLQYFVYLFNGILTSVCQILALVVIAFGVVRAVVIFFNQIIREKDIAKAFQDSRLAMGYSFSLSLSFLVGATILKTMISSQWDELARLTILIFIRTALNLLLERATKITVTDQSTVSHLSTD
ncbi:hypothetical protein NIES208_17970 [[Limnothrix rosea] IAM M-220]|nr:hypothetical protein NIES208_17970 [[Limnothrix rosea] IAM M-220]